MIINNGGDVEKLEPSYTSEGKLKQCSHFKASVTVRQEPKCRTPMWYSNSTHGQIAKRNEKKKNSLHKTCI